MYRSGVESAVVIITQKKQGDRQLRVHVGAEGMEQMDCRTGSLLGREESLLVKGERREQNGLNAAWEVVIPVGSRARWTGEESRLPASRNGAESRC